MILHNLREIFYVDIPEPVTIKNLPQNFILKNHSIVIDKGKIIDILKENEVLKKYRANKLIKCHNFVATPGFVDSHTHLAFMGSREDEWEQKILGKSYLEIAKEGGGILNTMYKTRQANIDELTKNIQGFIENIIQNGTTTVEIKSGYGLDFENEIKILKVIKKVQKNNWIKIVPTLLAAHAIPPEFANNKSEYVKLVIDKIIPYVAKNRLAKFCDIFVEEGFFTIEDARQILECAKQHNLKLKMHIDEFTHTGAVDLAIKLQVTSLEHLVYTSGDDAKKLSDSNIICVLLPATYFYTHKEYVPYGKMLWESGAKIAIATDVNPGTSMCFSMVDIVRLASLLYKVPLYVSLVWATHNGAFATDEGKNHARIARGAKLPILLWHAPTVKYIFYTSGLKLLHAIIRGKTGNLKFI